MNFRNIIMWGLIVLLSVGLFNLFQDPRGTKLQDEKIAFSKFLEEVDMSSHYQIINLINPILSRPVHKLLSLI